MTDEQILGYIYKTQRRVREDKFDYVGALKFYCSFMASGEKSYTCYVKKNAGNSFGYKSMQSLAAGSPGLYRNIKDFIGRDFWQEVVQQKPELDEIVPPEPKKKELCMEEFMANVMLDLKTIIAVLKNIQSIDGAHYRTSKDQLAEWRKS